MTNSTFNPTKVADFDKLKLNFNGMGVIGTATAGTTTNIDLALTDDNLITGAMLQCQNMTWGDSVSLQVVDVTGVYAPAGTVLSQFVTNWYVITDFERQIDLQINYPAKLLAGLYIRVSYTSTGTTAVNVSANYTLHKVMV
jgi:hypothetical protein